MQDIFATETAYLADVILPASRIPRRDGQLPQHRPSRPDRPAGGDPPGDACQDMWIIERMARRLGAPWHYWRAETARASRRPTSRWRQVFDECET